jgi:hypothetical protein
VPSRHGAMAGPVQAPGRNPSKTVDAKVFRSFLNNVPG